MRAMIEMTATLPSEHAVGRIVGGNGGGHKAMTAPGALLIQEQQEQRLPLPPFGAPPLPEGVQNDFLVSSAAAAAANFRANLLREVRAHGRGRGARVRMHARACTPIVVRFGEKQASGCLRRYMCVRTCARHPCYVLFTSMPAMALGQMTISGRCF